VFNQTLFFTQKSFLLCFHKYKLILSVHKFFQSKNKTNLNVFCIITNAYVNTFHNNKKQGRYEHMIDRKSRRVVIINNIRSETIDQAIFILKNRKPDKRTARPDKDIAAEAQAIINDYIHQVDDKSQLFTKEKTEERKFPGVVKIILSSIAFLLLLYFTFHIL